MLLARIASAIEDDWKAAITKRILNKDGEIIDKEFKKLTDTEKLKVQFFQSIAASVAFCHTGTIGSSV